MRNEHSRVSQRDRLWREKMKWKVNLYRTHIKLYTQLAGEKLVFWNSVFDCEASDLVLPTNLILRRHFDSYSRSSFILKLSVSILINISSIHVR